MVTNLSPATFSTPPPGSGSGFTMDQSAIDSLQQQADELRTGYEEVSSKLSGHTLAGNAFGSVGTFAAEAFNASNGRSVELAGKAASMLGLVGEALKATARTHLEADRANGEQFTTVESAEITEGPQGAPGGTPTPQGPPVTPTETAPSPDSTTPASKPTAPEVPNAPAAVPTAQSSGAPSGTPTAQTPPTTTGTERTNPAAARTATAPPPTAAPVPDFPEIPDPPPVPDGSAGVTGPATGTTPPPMPPIPDAPKDLFKQPTVPDSDTGTTGATGGAATTPPAGTTPPPTPPIPEVPKDLFKQPTLPDLGAGGVDADQTPTAPSDDPSSEDRPGGDPVVGEGDGRPEPEQHGFPVTEVDGKPCLDLRELPAEEGERWQEKIRDILATKGEGSFFWAGDTIDTEGRRHSLMDLAEFMTNLDGRAEPGREVSDDVTASPARSASGDVYVLVGPNRAEGDPVELADFPTLQGNPRIERVFAIDAVTGREVQIHPKVS